MVFLRKVVPGGCDRSYGIHVAQLAGLPRQVVHRAEEVLVKLEGERRQEEGRGVGRARLRRARPTAPEMAQQLHLFGHRPPLLDELARLDISSMSPLEAITKLYELQKKAKED